MLAWKIAPALAQGNTVVLKPAGLPLSPPLPSLRSARKLDCRQESSHCYRRGFDRRSAGQASRRSKIAFTGSTEVGRAIRNATASSHKRLSPNWEANRFHHLRGCRPRQRVEGLVDGICSIRDKSAALVHATNAGEHRGASPPGGVIA